MTPHSNHSPPDSIGPGSADPAVRSRAREVMARGLRLCHELGAPVIQLARALKSEGFQILVVTGRSGDAYADTADGQEDAEVLCLALEMLPARSPRRAGLVARLERLEA